MKHRFRPHRSVSLPPGIIRAAITSKKMVMAVCTPCTVVSRSSLMSLIITFMFEPAKLQMNCASASGTRIFRSEPDGRPTLTPSVTGHRHPRCLLARFGDGEDGAQEPDVREGLGEVAQQPLRRRVVLLAQEAHVVLQGEERSRLRCASSARPTLASALTSQNEQIRNAPSLPARPSTPSSVE